MIVGLKILTSISISY